MRDTAILISKLESALDFAAQQVRSTVEWGEYFFVEALLKALDLLGG